MSRRGFVRRQAQALTAALIAALLFGVPLVAWETVLIRSPGVNIWTALTAACAAMLPWLLVALGLSGAVALPLSSGRVNRWLNLQRQRSRLVSSALCAGLAAYGFYGAAKAAQVWLVAEGTRAIASALFAVAVLALIAGLWSPLCRLSTAKPMAVVSARTWLAGLCVLALPWLFGFAIFEPAVFVALSAKIWAPAWALLVASIIAALLLRPGRLALALSGCGLLTLSVVACGYWFSSSSVQLESAIESRSRLTAKLLDLQRSVVSAAPATKSATGSAHGGSCWPKVAAPAPAAIGKVRKNAPDILLVMVDGVRWDRTSLGGYSKNTTPNLKLLAKEGMVFERAYSNSASTRQTFRSLLTGLYPSQVAPSTGTNRWALTFPEGQETLASYLKAAGYRTISAQTSRVFFDEGTRALHGFEVDDRTPRQAWQARKYSADTHVDRIIAHLSEPEPPEPRFIFSHLMEPHKPFGVGPKRKFIKGAQSRYLSGIHYADEQLGRLLRFVLRPERRNNTVLVIASDHGLGHHGTSVADSQTRVPFLWFGAGIKPGSVKDAVGLIDIMPTLLDIAGLSVPEHLCGQSLRPTLAGQQEFKTRPVLVQIYPDATTSTFLSSFITNNHKLTLDSRKHVTRLFQLEGNDEGPDLGPEHPGQLAGFVTQLRQHLTERGLDPADYLK